MKPAELVLRCTRCAHRWLRRKLDEEPKQCPACRSPYWNRARVRKVRKTAA